MLNSNMLSTLLTWSSRDLWEVKILLTSPFCWKALGSSPANLEGKNPPKQAWLRWFYKIPLALQLYPKFSLSLSRSHDIHLPSTSRSWASLSLRSRLLKHSIAMVFSFDLESVCTTTERQVFHIFMDRIKLELMF